MPFRRDTNNPMDPLRLARVFKMDSPDIVTTTDDKGRKTAVNTKIEDPLSQAAQKIQLGRYVEIISRMLQGSFPFSDVAVRMMEDTGTKQFKIWAGFKVQGNYFETNVVVSVDAMESKPNGRLKWATDMLSTQIRKITQEETIRPWSTGSGSTLATATYLITDFLVGYQDGNINPISRKTRETVVKAEPKEVKKPKQTKLIDWMKKKRSIEI